MHHEWHSMWCTIYHNHFPSLHLDTRSSRAWSKVQNDSLQRLWSEKKDKTENEFDQERIFSLVCCSVLTIGFSSSFSGAKVDFRSKAAGFLCQRGSSVILWRARNKTKKNRVPTRKCIWLCFRYVIEFLMLIWEMAFVFFKSKQAETRGNLNEIIKDDK